MDWIRYLLFGAIIVTALLLLNEWTAFKRDHDAQVPVTAPAATHAAAQPSEPHTS